MSTNVTVEGVSTILPEEKRCYLPGIILKSNCPKCGEDFERDLSGDYLSYGNLNVQWYCEYEDENEDWVGCGTSWETPLRCEIHLFPAEPEKAEEEGDDDTEE